MAQNLTNFDAALRIDYLPMIRKQLNEATVLLDKVQRNTEDVQGKNWYLTAHYQRNSGVGSGAETGMPTAGNQAFLNPYGSVKYTRSRIQVSGPVMAASKSDTGAIVRALNTEIDGAMRDLKQELNYQLFNDGTSVRCLVNGDPSTGTTLTVDGPGTMYLQDGMVIDIYGSADADGAANDSEVTITSVDSATEVTVSAALDTAIDDNDYVVRSGSAYDAGSTVGSYEMMGLKGIADDSTYVTTLHNLSRSTYAWWKCATHSNDDNSGTNRNLTTALMQQSMSAVEKLGGKVDAILTTFELRDAYAALLVADKRYVNTMELDGGWKGLEFNGIPVIADKDCPPNTMFFVDFAHLFLMQMKDFDWMSEDGSVLSRVASTDAYEAALVLYADLATDRPRSFSFLRDVE